jgi:glutaredoxin
MSRATSALLLPLQVACAGWIGFGAFMKAWEFNPLLLPPPIMALLKWVVDNTSVDAAAFFEWSLRTVIGAEVFIALAILLSNWGRRIAMATLGLFCVILLIAMVQAGLKDGLGAALAGSCGCFGKSGLPASVMLAIDGALLAGLAFVCREPFPRRAPIWIPLVIGLVVGVAVPQPEVGGGNDTGAQNGETLQDPQTQPAPVAPIAISGPWPAAPAKYEKNYFPKWAEWIGKPFRAQKLALAIERPVPDDLEKGDWLVIFSRPDCDHCQALYREHFAAPRKERVLKVSILDTRGAPLGMPCEGCVATSLFRVKAGESGTSPNYLVQVPVVVRLKDGIVTAVCSDVDKKDDLEKVLGAPAVEAPKPPVAQEPAPRAAAWPAKPAKLAPFYIAEFADAVGKPLSANSLSPLIAGGVPADFQTGRWIVIFYREDCDHCHELLSTYFTGKLPVRTLAVAIPDADPNSILDNPCEECVKVSLVKGPNYVIQTPVLLAIQDGVVECLIENAEDMAALEGCLKFPPK